MPVTVTPAMRLSGDVALPGDTRTTLSALALAMASGVRVTMHGPSRAGSVVMFLRFLERHGSVITGNDETLVFKPGCYDGEVVIDDDVPHGVLAATALGGLFRAGSVRLAGRHDDVGGAYGRFCELLEALRMPGKCVTTDGGDVVAELPREGLHPEGILRLRSLWAFEGLCAAVSAGMSPVTVSYLAEDVAAGLALGGMAGIVCTEDAANGADAELERRLARASGEKALDVRRMDIDGVPGDAVLTIPGDTTVAAALAATASMTPHADIVMRDVLWEHGRRGFFETLRRMKGTYTVRSQRRRDVFETADIAVGRGVLEGVHVNAGQARSQAGELLVLGALAASASGQTVISDVEDGPGKGREAFRLLARGLEALGVRIGDYAEGIVLDGVRGLKGATLDAGGRGDVALALAVAASNAAGETSIYGFDCDERDIEACMALLGALGAGVS